jgi:MFS superfamily sulfate permease-like transporter
MPLFSSLAGYDRTWLRGDVLAGMTVWAVLVPEALAYASIAGVSPVVGLYAAPGAPLLFVNAKRLRNGIRDQVRDADPPVRVVLLDLSFTPGLDIESVDVLASLHHELGARGVADAIGRAHLYRSVEDATGDVSA